MRIQLPRVVSDSGSSPFPVHPHLVQPFEDPCNLLSHNREYSDYFLDSSCSSPRSSVGSSPSASSSLSDASIPDLGTSKPCPNSEQHNLSNTQQKDRMPKKHASLQSIFVPPFLSYPIPSVSDTPSLTARPSVRARALSTSRLTRATPSFIRSSEAAVPEPSSPPPDFLLDDDPFANYTGASPLQPHYGTSTSSRHSRKTSLKQPRSPLGAEPCPVISPSPSSPSSSSSPSASSNAEISHPAPLASGRQLRPAYTRPAFAPRPSLPSLHTLAQSDFLYSVKTRKGTLGARLPLEPWDVSAGQDVVSEDVPSILGPEHTTELPRISEFPPGPESLVVVNEDIHAGDSPDVTAGTLKHQDIHILDSEATFIQSPTFLEPGPEDSSHMVSPLFEALSASPPTLSRSSSSSSTSSVPALSPDFRTQSPTPSPNRFSSEESASVDLSSDNDIIYSLSESLQLDVRDSESLDLFAMSESLSGADSFQPGTSAGTVRPLVNSIVSACVSPPFGEDWTTTLGGYVTPEFDEAEMYDEYAENFGGAVDGDDQEDRRHRTTNGYEGRQTNEHRGGGRNSGQVNGSDSNGNGRGLAGGNHGSGGRDDRRDDERDWKATSAFSTPSDTESEDSEEDDESPSAQRSEEFSTSGDDNVPLAQRIPTALRAQQTIRKQVREEKDERRRQRASKRQQQKRQEVHNQTLLGEEHHAQRGPGLAQTSNLSVASSSRTTRLRTKTLPSNTSRPVVAKDLARRLKDLQDLNVSPPSFVNKQPPPTSDSAPHPGQVTQRAEGDAWIPSVGAQDKTLRPMRSFHRPNTADSARAQPLPLPPQSHETSQLRRRATSASRPVGRHDHSEPSARATSGPLSKSSRRPQTSDGGNQSSATVHSVHHPVLERISLPHMSTNVSDTSPALSAVPKETKQISWQQRIFVMDLQRFNAVVMNPMTTAGDVIDVLEAQGQLTAGRADVGGWMLFEVFQDFGMERSIRNFEVVSEVINSWDKDKSVNILVAKKTPLAALLHPSVMPSSSPVFSSYVEWESKPRKWSKRWLELREQGLWLSKKDNGKDEIFLCSLANFDAYVVTRTHKPPKPYVFAAKSTDSLSFFENAADYVHTFCCSEKDGRKWLENILLARSYFINQERNTLSARASTSGGASGTSISHSGTRKGSRIAQQLLVNMSPSGTTASTPSQPYAFEPGSLLSRR